jgi:hypothetical protein
MGIIRIRARSCFHYYNNMKTQLALHSDGDGMHFSMIRTEIGTDIRPQHDMLLILIYYLLFFKEM